ncbi:hypothetical protein [Pedobacter jamesrossensis]|uniref:GAF domain-containing protein n=1 Tax=Pedobacter jamesrossensis TaxID=1908238 RepID=A0ABV8NGQ6_9SPHI
MLEKLINAKQQDEVINIIETHFLTTLDANYAEVILNSKQDLIFDLNNEVAFFDLKNLIPFSVNKVYISLWMENEINHIVAIPITKSTVIKGQILLGFKTQFVASKHINFQLKTIASLLTLAIERINTEQKNQQHQQKILNFLFTK